MKAKQSFDRAARSLTQVKTITDITLYPSSCLDSGDSKPILKANDASTGQALMFILASKLIARKRNGQYEEITGRRLEQKLLASNTAILAYAGNQRDDLAEIRLQDGMVVRLIKAPYLREVA